MLLADEKETSDSRNLNSHVANSYGYRGRDCRANLYFLPTGEAVYFNACVVVLYHINNRTQRHYRKHTDCVRWSVGSGDHQNNHR